MTSFAAYSRYYSALYEDKDYSGETRYISELMRQHALQPKRLLDVGCGTGKHAFLFEQSGVEVTGIDRSPTMLEQARFCAKAKGSSINFIEADIRDFDLGSNFDVVVALFHVMSYVVSNNDVIAALNTIRRHLSVGGLFIFDFWYGPGVLTDRPTQRQKRTMTVDSKVRRFATPHLWVNENTVSIEYNIDIFDCTTNKHEEINETHVMRYYFKPELTMMLQESGYEMISFYEWMTYQSPSDRSWNAAVVARAV